MPGYRVRSQQVSIAGGADLTVRSLLDRQQFSDPLGEAAAAGISEATWPLFGQLWPSSEKLADLMQLWKIGGLTVLEIGCGLALASMVVHRRQGDITASDHHPLAETFLKANLLLNELPKLKYQTGNWGRENLALGRFDLIIGGECSMSAAIRRSSRASLNCTPTQPAKCSSSTRTARTARRFIGTWRTTDLC